ncbi:MAG: hypothetical protein RL207_1720 [Bacteroidota bacterium]|jgi:hypothetical protein
MKLFIFILLIGLTGISQAQKAKIKIDGDIVLVNGEPAFILESPFLSASYNLYNIDHQPLAYFSQSTGTKKIHTSEGIKYQNFTYLSVTFNNEEQSKCETGTFPVKKLMAIMIVKNGLVENGQLNNNHVVRFCEERGFYYSSRR